MHDTPHARCMIYMHSSNNTSATATTTKYVVFRKYLYDVYYAREHIVFENVPRRVMCYVFLLVRVYVLSTLLL